MEITPGPLLKPSIPPPILKSSAGSSCKRSVTSCAYIIDTVSVHGGHFAASLGVVELTVALHYVFNTPYDQLVWDVGHQAYGP